jgi:hypothetical protein
MAKTSLRTGSIVCLALWAGIWALFMLSRFSSFDVRQIPDAGPILLLSLVTVFLAPVAASAMSAVALMQRPRLSRDWFTLGCALAALFGQAGLFVSSAFL